MPDRLSHGNQSRLLTKNYLLNALPEADWARLLPELEPVELEHGAVIYRHDDPIEYVYFPNQAMVSVIATTPGGQQAEVGVVGNEGIVGIDVLLGAERAFNETIVQLPDGALRIKTKAIRREFKLGGALQDRALSFIRLMLLQVGQTALCNRLHTVEERLARWLLLCHDRAPGDELPLTQEFLAIMLGANRATVTTAAITLQGGGMIKYVRGLITMLGREGLEHFTCDCYRTVREEYDRVQK